uniref:Adenosine deaminase n=1 Tax=Spodoptera frugiperda TaxID=7108 RepID=A0A2H1W0Y1_SPOFR
MDAAVFCVTLCLLITANTADVPAKYYQERSALLAEEIHTAVGGKVSLNENETIANNVLMKWKEKELSNSNAQRINFAKHYFSYKKDIEKSKVYKIIRKMSKGGLLHVHSTLLLHEDVLIQFTYEDYLYACFANNDLSFYYATKTPDQPCATKWELVSDLRNNASSPEAFDTQLKQYLTIYNDKGVDCDYQDMNAIWQRFSKVGKTMGSLISYRPIRERYCYETLKQFYNDNIMYAEIRISLFSVYELDGSKHTKEYMVELYKNTTAKFIEDHPDFVGVKLIITQSKIRPENVLAALNMTRRLKVEVPDMIAGFDLVGQENTGKPLTEYLPILYEAKDEINYYFHAGETNLSGTAVDENLVDAILLGSKRIGHGYALTKHPSLMSAVMKKDIALEVNVISNVVLSLVHDVRNHPLASYLAMGAPVVLSSDDPGAWSAEPLSHDFFVAFMGVASKHADLRMLKQLALNSITYSALDEEGKARLLKVFNERWDRFVRDVITDVSLLES